MRRFEKYSWISSEQPIVAKPIKFQSDGTSVLLKSEHEFLLALHSRRPVAESLFSLGKFEGDGNELLVAQDRSLIENLSSTCG